MLLTLCTLRNPAVFQVSTTKSLVLRVTLTVLLLLQMAPSQAAPHHVPQQQQLLYYNHVTPPQTLQSTNVVVVPGNGAGYVLYIITSN
jgi:hypothetical protein